MDLLAAQRDWRDAHTTPDCDGRRRVADGGTKEGNGALIPDLVCSFSGAAIDRETCHLDCTENRGSAPPQAAPRVLANPCLLSLRRAGKKDNDLV